MRHLRAGVEDFPIAGAFVIARGAKTQASVVVATITERDFTGRGECVPYARYGETVDSVLAQIGSAAPKIEAGLDKAELQAILPAGAARNALDCALWDLEAKRTATPAFRLAGLDALAPLLTAFTLSLGTPEAMAAAATAAAAYPLLKVKLGGAGDPARIAAVRQAAPEARLIVDANEAWRPENLAENLAACAKHGVALVEQPLPAGADCALARIDRSVPICADESLHERRDLRKLRDRYDAVNIKLDKAGGLSEALALQKDAESLGFSVMIGCMVATSLAMAPALLLAQRADFVDLDGPLLLARDRDNGLRYDGARVYPPAPALWG